MLTCHSSIHITPLLTWQGPHLCADVAGDQPPQHPAPRPRHHQRVRQKDVPIGDSGGGLAAARGGRRNLVRPVRELGRESCSSVQGLAHSGMYLLWCVYHFLFLSLSLYLIQFVALLVGGACF